MSVQQGSKQTFTTPLTRRRVLMVESEIMNDDLDIRTMVIVMKVDFEEILPSRIYQMIEGISPEDQDLYICNWLEERIGFKADFRISFYPGKFSKERRSIIPAGDTSQFIPSRDADVAKF
ncbi:hypothetical protein KY289_006493 [Solanum tuberosum]|nr:hypothetical protein KY289_006493 [Solanum tuberosum]